MRWFLVLALLAGCSEVDGDGAEPDATSGGVITYDAVTYSGQTVTPQIGDGGDVPPVYQVWMCSNAEYGTACSDATDQWRHSGGFLCPASLATSDPCYGGDGFVFGNEDITIRWVE